MDVPRGNNGMILKELAMNILSFDVTREHILKVPLQQYPHGRSTYFRDDGRIGLLYRITVC
jgi:hypothetical protein